MSQSQREKLRNHFAQCPTETGTKWLLSDWEFLDALPSMMSLWKCPNSIASQIEANKTQGSGKKVVPYRLVITVLANLLAALSVAYLNVVFLVFWCQQTRVINMF